MLYKLCSYGIACLVAFFLFRYSRNAHLNEGSSKEAPAPDVKRRADVVEPLREFDWSSTDPIPYRPFKTNRHVAMGISRMDKADWIRFDKGYLKRLEERIKIMDAHPRESIGSGPEVNNAIEELYESIMIDFLPCRFPTMFALQGKELCNKVTGKTYSVEISKLDHGRMLRNLGENVEEDFYFMCPDGNDELRLEGWIACFPGGFLTTSRKGHSMRQLHQPVPGYKHRLATGADRRLTQLEAGEFIERYNWSLQTDGEDLFRVDGNNFYPEQSQTIPDSEDDPDIDQCFLRVEHQTLVRLGRSRAVIFCVRSYMTSLEDIRKEGSGVLLAEAIQSMPEKLGNYKKRPFWQSSIDKFLRDQ